MTLDPWVVPPNSIFRVKNKVTLESISFFFSVQCYISIIVPSCLFDQCYVSGHLCHLELQRKGERTSGWAHDVIGSDRAVS